MKYYLFVDNFRGFSNTRIPITDVNFLVGENSTGKTSILQLIKLFSGSRFLMNPNQEFGDEHINFGHFSDMVSVHSDDRSSFHIGLAWRVPAKKDGVESAIGWLCTYVEEQGMPRLANYRFYRDSSTMSLRISGNNIDFKVESHEHHQTAESIIDNLFPQSLSENRKDNAGYDRLDSAGFPGRMPIFWALSMIAAARERPNQEKPKKRLDFGLMVSEIPFVRDITWVAPIRTRPKRTYDELMLDFSPEGAHTPYLIRKTLRSRRDAVKFRAFIHKVGKASGLFQDIQIKNFGKGITAPFEVDVVLDNKALNLSTVGYGVSQSLPVLVEILDRPPGTWFAIQQPEVHLHPRAQAALGDVFFEMATDEHKCFLVETHSDYTIDRFRMKYKEGRGAKPDSQILFFERRENHNVATPIQIGVSGELPADQPDSYREFFVREEMRLLGIE